MENYKESDFYKNASPEDQAEWDNFNAMLEAEGLTDEIEPTAKGLAKAGMRVVSFEKEKKDVRDMQNRTDDSVEEENIWGDPIDGDEGGLPPCLKLKRFQENQYGVDDKATDAFS